MGKLSLRYGIRARKVGPETQKNLGQVGSVLRHAYRNAIQEEIYDRTPRPVTGRLKRSIVIRYLGNAVVVGHNPNIATYATYRRRMTGIGVYQGIPWNKTTQWDETAQRRAAPVVGSLTRGMHRRILKSRS